MQDVRGMLRIGMIGMDNSRIVHFARLCNDASDPHHLPGARIVAGWPGEPSPDFPMSALRVDGYVSQLRDRYGVMITGSIAEVAAQCDAWMLESVDGRVHEALFEEMLPYRKPIFVDKPFALSSAAASRMIRRAEACGTRFMSCSALRYADALTQAIREREAEPVKGADCYGPLQLEPTQPGYFWYGIHTTEMLFRALGPRCVSLRALRAEDHDVVVGVWDDGRIGTIRGNRAGNEAFGGTLHRSTDSEAFQIAETDRPYLASLLEAALRFFGGGETIEPMETLAIVRFLEAANESIRDGKTVRLF
ncbi:Gfo/Idh/MocA family protein [Cohnella sp. REN36]|uniref:Gfo/Idh/MocA family protein n=1 Tax=Cohnella sp. REN36 TaxID=2887347 RepID=UPI001D15D235|nr:gfo/Idh/MocA family oxidoreductase [Cohnella sp. REN36]MCC3374782.1 gfo/Idh/MocA family oxidoreductase [Cohnella sp. REN36]